MMSEITLPGLDDFKPVDQQQILDFRENGHVLIRDILNADEAATYRKVINDAAYRYNTEKRSLEDRDTYGKAFLQVMNLWAADEQVKKFTLAKRFAKIAADILGVDNVRIYHDQALFKEPGGGLTPWHQDQYYWPLDTNNTITMWMPLIDISVEMGMLTFASGSQRSGFVENVAISDHSEKLLQQFVEDHNYPISRPNYMNAGDATFHYGWTLHNAPGNVSKDITREVMTVIYFADGARITEPQNAHQENDRKQWLGSLGPGSKAASTLNPLVL